MGANPRIGPVSAVVCNYNGESYLQGCLESILGQVVGGDAYVDEVIVVDNGSTDRGLELVRDRFPDVRIVELGSNGGPCVARNAGMRVARNRWVLAVDNDAVLLPEVTSRLAAALETRPDAVAAQTRNVFAGDVGTIHYDGAYFHFAGLLSLRNFYRPFAEADGEGVLVVPGLIAICILIDRDVALAAGGYDEDYFYLFEDYDLALRLAMEGRRCLSVEDAVTLHRGGTPGMSFREGAYPPSRAYFHSRNRWVLLLKNYRWRTLILCAPALLAYEFAWALFTVVKGRAKSYLLGKWHVLRGLENVLRKRRAAQAHRTVPDRELMVGGPITLTPMLLGTPRSRVMARSLDLVLRGWWGLVRKLCG